MLLLIFIFVLPLLLFCNTEWVMLLVGISQEIAPRISAADLEVSRNRISGFLSRHIAYDLLPDSGKV